MTMEHIQVVIVGAGPAGLAAAAEASRAGAQVVVLDEQPTPGGQYLRQRCPDVPQPDDAISRAAEEIKATLLRDLFAHGVEIRTETSVWAAFAGDVLAVQTLQGSRIVHYERLVVATGAYDRPVAFPGWTLPGVFTAGGAQALTKGYGVVPGRRVLVAGSGPFLFPAAVELVRAGAEVVGVLEATTPFQWRSGLGSAWRHRERVPEALHYFRLLRAARVPIRFGRVVTAAEGEGHVDGVMTARVDTRWRPIAGTEERVAVDAVCVGFGFLPSTELTRALALQHQFDGLRGGWIPVHDADMQTSAPQVFVAGEAAGIGSAQVALLSGRLAGIAVARSLGLISARDAETRMAMVRPDYQHARDFADLILRTFAIRPGLLQLITDNTLVCRCEEIAASRVRARAREWRDDLHGIKGALRIGMGQCQGRNCGRLMTSLLSDALATGEADLGMLSVRAPLKTISVAALAGLELDDE